MKTKIAVFKGKTFNKYVVNREDGQIYRRGSSVHLKGFDNGHGYDLIDMMDDNAIRIRCKRHFIVAHTYLGPQPPNTIINHKNGIKKDCRPCNLEYIDQRSNVAHAQRLIKGLPYYEEDLWSEVNKLRAEGKKISEIASILDVKYHVIRDKLYGKTYKVYK